MIYYRWESYDWEDGEYGYWWNYPSSYQVWGSGVDYIDGGFDEDMAQRILDRCLDLSGGEYLYQVSRVVLDSLIGQRVWLIKDKRIFPAKIISTDAIFVNIEFEGEVYALVKAVTFAIHERFDFMIRMA